MVIQGASELGSALFQGNAYVPYGAGQDTREHKSGVEVNNFYGHINEQDHAQDHQMDRGREGRGR